MTANILQRTDAWHKARIGMVTASIAGAALGVNPYRTPDDVIRRMVRDYHGADPEFTGNAATEWGTFHEAGIMAEYAMETGNTPVECGFFVHPEYAWLGASPDGLIGDDTLLEIKAPYGQRDKNPPEFKSAIEQPHYWVQMQVQMACTGRDLCHFYQWSPHGTRLEVVRIDRAWLHENIPMLKAFHARYLSELDNPAHLEDKRVQVNTSEAATILAEIDRLRLVQSESKAAEQELLTRLIELAGGKSAEVHGRKLTLVKGGSSISYAKAVAELAPGADLSKWTTQRKDSWRLT